MVKVRAITKGYVGGMLREIGDVFEWPEGNKVGSWVKPVAFDGKGDHDGDGLTGGSVPSDPAGDDGDGKGKRGRKKGKAEPMSQDTAEPFADAPPVRVSNEINDATGGTAPDWLPPSDDGKPVMADD